MANHKAKFITMMGSSNGVGTTTLANYVGVELARRGYYTLLIEFSTKTGYTVYMQKGVTEMRRSLSEVMILPEKLNDNTVKSAHTPKLRYLCLNLKDDCLKMRNYQPIKMSGIISLAKKYYDYIILDLPSNNLEPIIPTVYSSEFTHKPDHQFIVVDERANTFKYLNDLNAVMQLANEMVPRDTSFILNSVEAAHYQDYIIEYLPSLPITKPVNLVYVPKIEGLSVICNSGKIYDMSINPTTKLFCKQIDQMADIIEKDLKNIKSDIGVASQEKPSLFGSIFGSFLGSKSNNSSNSASKKANKTDLNKKPQPKRTPNLQEVKPSSGRGYDIYEEDEDTLIDPSYEDEHYGNYEEDDYEESHDSDDESEIFIEEDDE